MSVPPVEPLFWKTVAKATPVSTQPIIIDMKSCPSPISLKGNPFSFKGYNQQDAIDDDIGILQVESCGVIDDS